MADTCVASAPTPSTLIVRFRNMVADEHLLTQEEIADELGVSLRTVSNWLNADVTPKKKYRRQLSDWLEQREAA